MLLAVVSSGDFFSDYGGGQIYVRNIVDELVRRQDTCQSENNTPKNNNITPSVISFNKNGDVCIKEYKGINVYQVNDKESFRNALVKIQPDIVHSNGEKLLSARLCKELGIPCIVTAHHGGLVCPAGTLLNTDDEICSIPSDYRHCLKCYLRNTPTGLFWYPLLKHYSQKHYCRIGKRLEKLPAVPFLTPIGRTGQIVTQKIKDWQELAETATHFIAPSNAIADALQRNGCPAGKITVIPHGIPYVQSTPSSPFSVLRSPFINFYYVGRINYVKGIHILLKAFSSIDNPDIRLHLIGGAGNNSERRYMKRLQRQYKKDNRIIWHGKVPYELMADIIKEFQCLVHPAIYLEVFGLNISESLAQHKYVIATRCGGPEMQINDYTTGWLVAPNNVKEMHDALQRYCSEKPQPSFGKCKPIEITDHVESLMSLYTKCRQ